MKSTTPVEFVHPNAAMSSLGLFAEAAPETVIARIRQDLEAAGRSSVDLAAAYAHGISLFGEETSSLPNASTEESLINRLFSGELHPSDLGVLVKILYFSGYQRLLAKHRLRFPAYNILDEYFSNETSPLFPIVLPRPRASHCRWSLFGKSIGLPIGVPASVLTGNSRWIQYLASNGFNVLTYKTVRSREQGPNEAPNWAFIPDETNIWPVSDAHYKVIADPWDWVNPGEQRVTTTNSFGVPSLDPRHWMADVENALSVIANDQLLIVSVMGDDYDEGSAQLSKIADDFLRTAQMAEAAGASIIELNLSCPNSLDTTKGGVRPPICYDLETTCAIIDRVRSGLSPSTAIVAKLSYLNDELLTPLIHRIAPSIDGVAGINTLQCTVKRTNDSPTFPGRELAGVSGYAIRDYAFDFIGRLSRLRIEAGHYFEIIGMGGVTDPESFAALYELGATAVQSASGTFANPFLAYECVREYGETLPDVPEVIDPAIIEVVTSAISEVTKLTPAQIAAVLPLRTQQGLALVDKIAKEQQISFG